MSTPLSNPILQRRPGTLAFRAFLAGILAASVSPLIADIVSQAPLQVGSGIHGNLALVPSVEFPTINSVANQGAYTEGQTYTGYFDPRKCYQYEYNQTESQRHFYPVKTTTDHRCTSDDAPWSGNFLNWAATQTIDPFRSALSGGYRVVDTPTETWLEKARHDGQMDTTLFPNRRLPESGNSANAVQGATPFDDKWIRMRVEGLGNKMRFRIENNDINNNVAPYDREGNNASKNCKNNGCEVSIRVKVCVTGLLEANCKRYAQGWKPEGTLQEYSDRMRYAAFGYLTDNGALRDGGVLRARMKYIGTTMPTTEGASTQIDNPRKEWNPVTGVLIANPDPDDASATSTAIGKVINFSGVIQYLNGFGQQIDQNNKNYDPVSELYYAAIRYFKNLGNVPAYTNMSGTATAQFNLADGFPVITDWADPVVHWCRQNTILGIGDIYTHRDKNLPGSSCGNGEPAKPAQVSSDATVNVVDRTNQVGQMEGLGDIGETCDFTGRTNSAFITGLAWDSRVRDIRPDLTGGKTTISTYWVDVLEAQSLEGMGRNQYALAAKYGGARVPTDFDPDTWGNQALPEGWWHSNGETLTPFGGRGSGQPAFKRPDNFFTAGDAPAMVESLEKAFKSIAAEMTGSGASLASNSTKLETGTRTFQAQYFSREWRGELTAFDVDPTTGRILADPVWWAGGNIPAWAERKIYFHDPASAKYAAFTWAELSAGQQGELQSESVVDYLRGDRSNEEPNGAYRQRGSSVLGDIIHSQPVYVGRPLAGLYADASFSGAGDHSAFAQARENRTPIVYVGANDGMLHGFKATTGAEAGAEAYAFVPNQVIFSNLKSLASPDYQHRYFVDGEMTAADVYFTGNGGGWRTVLVGTLGRGGPGIFALDVTDPSNVSFLWEKNNTDIPALGRNVGKPIVAQVADGDWRVVLGNGPDSADGKAELVMVRVQDGTVSTIDTEEGDSNGLSAVYTWDSDYDGFMDTAYAGDLRGNLWRFTSLASGSGRAKLFEARDGSGGAQPITAAPLVSPDPETGALWVFFGTGRYLSDSDPLSTDTQTWYGIIDTGAVVGGGRSDLVEREILAEGEINGFGARVISEGTAGDLVGKRGWFIDLVPPGGAAEGERMVVPNQFQGRALIGTTRIPDASDVCRPTGRGFVMAIDPFSGGRLGQTFFDLTLDSLFNDSDKLEVNGVLTVVSGVGFVSSPNNPIFIEDTMQVSLDDGSTDSMNTQGSDVEARRTGWREILGD